MNSLALEADPQLNEGEAATNFEAVETPLPSLSGELALRGMNALATGADPQLNEQEGPTNFDEESGTPSNIIAGAGMTQTGDMFDVIAEDNSLEINPNSMRVKLDGPSITLGPNGLSVTGAAVDVQDLLITNDPISVSADGTTDIVADTDDDFISCSQRILVGAGGGPFTHNLAMKAGTAVPGSIFEVSIQIAGSTNPTIDVYNDSPSGAWLERVRGQPGATYYYLKLVFTDAGAWEKRLGVYT